MKRLAQAVATAALAWWIAGVGMAAAQEPVAEPDDYRMSDYRAPVPETVAWGRVLDDFDALEQQELGTPFIDVMPRPEKPADLPEGTLWIDKQRLSIPGALYAPNVGYGKLDEATDRYFRHVLALATDGDPEAPVVIFCQANCWMSWNAARRAMVEYGYVDVQWYPDGADGWSATGGELVPIDAVPRPDGD